MRVTFTDGGGTEEVLTSVATEAVAARAPDAPGGVAAATAAGREGELDVSWTVPSSDGGSEVTGYKVQWKSGAEAYDGSASSTREAVLSDPALLSHRIAGLTVGTAYTVRVLAVNAAGDGASAEVEATAEDRVVPTLTAASVNGTSLTLTFSEALDAASKPSADAFAVTVAEAARTVDEVALSGSAVTLTLASAVASGETVTVGYSQPTGANASPLKDAAGNDAAGFSGQAVTNETPAPENAAPTGLPEISGNAQVGEVLTASKSAIEDADGLESATFAWQWLANDGTDDTEIEDADEATYTPVAADLGKTLKVRVTFTDDGDTEETLTSAATATVTRPPPRAPELDGITVHDGMLRVSGGRLELSDSVSVPAADVGTYISSFKVQWKSGSQDYDATRQAVLAPEPVTASATLSVSMPSYDITGLTNGTEYTVRVIATNAGGDSPPSQEQAATPKSKTEQLRQYIEDEIVEEHEASHPWLRQTWSYLQSNNISLSVTTGEVGDIDTYSANDASGLGGTYIRSWTVSESIVDEAEATKKNALIGDLAYIYTRTNGLASSPAPLGMANVYFRSLDSYVGCYDIKLFLDVVTSLVTHGSLAAAQDWKDCMSRSEDATALAVVRSALSGQTPAWFPQTYHDEDGNADLEQFWSDVRTTGEKAVAYQLRDAFGGYCDTNPNFGLRIARSMNRALAGVGFNTLVNPWRDGGCVPGAPTSLSASLEGDGTATVSWGSPANTAARCSRGTGSSGSPRTRVTVRLRARRKSNTTTIRTRRGRARCRRRSTG